MAEKNGGKRKGVIRVIGINAGGTGGWGRGVVNEQRLGLLLALPNLKPNS
jgi:hypothetical protein